MNRICLSTTMFLFALGMSNAQMRVVYSSIPNPLPGNVASEGPEAYAFAELGDGLGLVGAAGGTLDKVSVVLSSWGCENGSWFSNNCVSKKNATFSQPITINVYSVLPGPMAGTLLGTTTETFNIPYRPTSTPAQCGGDASRWYSNKDNTCYHGIATTISSNFASQHITVPANGQLLVTVAFNSTHYGPAPIGESAPCFTSSGGCPYDSLNISTDSSTGFSAGSPVDPNGIFVNYTNAYSACSPGTQITGVLALDTGCWAGFHPEIEVRVNTNSHPSKGNPI